MDDTRKTVVLDRDLFGEAKDGSKSLIARKGERISPAVAKKHGVLPIESAAGTPVLESKVVGSTERSVLSATAHKRER
jgi:hypothetical protein|tara:strand:+ start:565 stop:798 length:234 start_codon:yes stop_codon:yes gene_type:complete